MKRPFALLSLLALVGCQNTPTATQPTAVAIPELSGTKWQCANAEGCADSYKFLSDLNFVFYSCDGDYKAYGKYHVSGDTLIVCNLAYDLDSLSIYDSRRAGTLGKTMNKILIEGSQLRPVEKWTYSEENASWQKDTLKFPQDYLFVKAE